MKKGTQIQITDNANYNGQYMDWTETFTGIKSIGKGGEVVFHKSNVEITEFRAKEICVSPNNHGKGYLVSNATKKQVVSKYNWTQYIYMIFLPEGAIVNTYSNDEYRFNLDSQKVIFAGVVLEAANKIEREMTDSGLKEISTYIQFSDTIN